MCNLASIAVNQFVDAQKKIFDFNRLKEVTKVVTKNLNKIINVNYYPVPEARKSNMRHRPIGIGVSSEYIRRAVTRLQKQGVPGICAYFPLLKLI